jgi:outer membrane protein assembly factor BamB
VTIANGLLYWWPSTCDCNLSLYGITSLGPAGNFDFAQAAKDAERFEQSDRAAAQVAEFPATPTDWPTFRANNTASSTTEANLPARSRRLWQTVPHAEFTPTAPTVVNGMVFVSGSDGVVRAFDATSSKTLWTTYTGGSVRFPPTIWNGRAFVASGDGWVYSFEAKTGRLLWRFRAAPVERKIPVYGQLLSTWPAASGVIVQDGVAYVAAGIVNFDGTHVYALDATTGRLKWQNNSSGHLDAESIAGVSVQGNMIIHDGKLWLAGGNVVSPAMFDLADGKCLNDVGLAHRTINNNVPATESPRGSELYLVAGHVMVSDQPLYAHPKWKVYDGSVQNKTWVSSMGDRDVTWVNNAKVVCYPRVEEKRSERFIAGWGKPRVQGLEPLWEAESKDSAAVALSKNALVVARPSEIVAYNLQDGKQLWSQTLAGTPVPWGLAVDRAGRVIVSLEGGQVVCFGSTELRAAR